MAIKVKQYTKQNICAKGLKLNFEYQIQAIGIQSSIQGVRFTFSDDDKNWISIGTTGVYELKKEDQVVIKSIRFDDNEQFKNAEHVVVDIIYEI